MRNIKMLDFSESNANPSNMNEEDENILTYTTLEVLIPSNFEEVIEVQNDSVVHETEQFNDAEILNTIVIPEDQQEEKGEQQQDEEEDLVLTKRGTKRVRKKISTTQKEKVQNRIKTLKVNHPTRDPCRDKCRYKCSTRFSEEWRNQCKSEFWDNNFTGRRDFIMLCVPKLPVKRRRGESESRNNSFRYFFNDKEGERSRVCKWFFPTTLVFSKENNSVIYDTLTYVDKNIMTGMSGI
ncbi:hypothetical protein WA026_023739 [Henosepilachna vigintioctopunctata]|uniref:Uncharacterized protein n=1 Tax=Henosepilachna vigintioctopunctata TaxID=420089 RepID=A0AAW1UHE0_9CUCU